MIIVSIDVNLSNAYYNLRRLLTIWLGDGFMRLTFLAWITTFYHYYSNLLITLKTLNFLWFV